MIVLGDGEKKGELIEYIKRNKINNFYLLGYQNNPFKFLSKSKLYICSSLWEDPGHTLIEAGYLNIPILTSNCPNGPNEIIQNDYNGMKYELGNKEMNLCYKKYRFKYFTVLSRSIFYRKLSVDAIQKIKLKRYKICRLKKTSGLKMIC